MKRVLDIAEDSFIVCGVVISIDQIKTILGIVLLVLQIVLIVIRLILYFKGKQSPIEEDSIDIKKINKFKTKFLTILHKIISFFKKDKNNNGNG